MQFNIIDFLPTPGEKYLGVVRFKSGDGKMTFRYKIQMKKDGSGYFPCAASIKGPSIEGRDNYLNSFEFDSAQDREDLEHAIRQAVKRFVDPASVHNAKTETPKAIPIERPQERASQTQTSNYTQQQQKPNSGQGNVVPFNVNEEIPF